MGGLSHSSILSCLLLAVLLPCLSEAAVVRLQRIKIFQTHDLPFWKPSVYFQCEGEPKRQLDVVVEANVDYNFTMHEPFQPLTELTAPKCKQCGFYDADTLTEDDAFDRFTLCPLDFTPAPSGRLNRLVESELNVTFVCLHCNPDRTSRSSGGTRLPVLCPLGFTPTPSGRLNRLVKSELNVMFVCLHCNPDRTSRSSGDEFEGTDTNNVSLLYVFLLVIGVVTGITCLTGLVAFWLKSGAWPLFRRRMDSDTAKFMEMFDEEDELLDGDDGSGEDMEMGEAGGTASSSPPSMTSASNRHGSAIRHD